MGDPYEAIKQKWEIGLITTGVGSSWIMVSYKLKALHQKRSLYEQQCCSQETK